MTKGRRTALAFWLWALLTLVCSQPAWSCEALAMQLIPAWGGWFRPGRTTELAITLKAARNGEYLLTLTSTGKVIRYNGYLEADHPRRHWLPVQPGANGVVHARLQCGNEEVIEDEHYLIPSGNPLFGVGMGATWPPYPPQQWRGVTDSRLPHTPQGYSSLDLLYLNAVHLTTLGRDQSLALDRYLAGCGHVILTGKHREWAERIEGIAGCNGRNIHQQYSEFPNLESSRSGLPGMGALEALIQSSTISRQVSLFGTLFLGYFGLLVVGERTRYKPFLLMAVPLTFSLSLILFWQIPTQQARLVSWVEIDTDNSGGRFSALLQVEKLVSQDIPVSLPTILGPPETKPGADIDWRLNQQQPAKGLLHGKSQAFTTRNYGFQGTLRLSPSLSLVTTLPRPVVRNRDKEPTPGGFLAWNGSVHRLPSLKPEQSWSPSEADLIQVENGTTRLLMHQTGENATALVLPFSLRDAGLEFSDIETVGWLMIRARKS
ncbi:MAG: hypothetical protein GY703_20965 [Gammaproteobacteria bacterium]|nr:hypothetical protein [Gammaproteobacteria bacterium]